MERPKLLRDLAAEALSPGAPDVGLRNLDAILKPISKRAKLLNGCRLAVQALLVISGLTLAAANILEPFRAQDADNWWPLAFIAALILAVDIIWYGYQYWFQTRLSPGPSGSPESERLSAFLAKYRTEQARAYQTEFEAVDAKIFSNRLAPLLLSDDQEDRLLVRRSTLGTYRAPLMSITEPATASVAALDNGIVTQEPIVAAAPADFPAERSLSEPESVRKRPRRVYDWQWLTQLTDDEFRSGLERFLDKEVPPHQAAHYSIALKVGRQYLRRNHVHGSLALAINEVAAALKRDLHCAPGLDGTQSTVWIKLVLSGRYRNVKHCFLSQRTEIIS